MIGRIKEKLARLHGFDNSDLEDLVRNPDFLAEVSDRIEGTKESIIRALREFYDKINGIQYLFEKENQQERGVTYYELFELLSTHPKYKIHHISRNFFSSNGSHSMIGIRPRNHGLVQSHEICHAIRELEKNIGVTPFKRSLELWPYHNAFGIPRIFYKNSISSKRPRITEIVFGLCDYIFSDERLSFPTKIVYPNIKGIPCPYQCQHKERCSYVNPRFMVKEGKFNPKQLMP